MATKTNRSYAELQADIQALQAQADAARKAEVASVVSRMREAINTYGLSAEDLGFRMGGRGRAPAKGITKTVGVAKYMDPKSGKTWTGRGKPPTWIVGAKNRDDFLIKDGSRLSSVASTSGAGTMPKALRAGAGVAKYQDPKTGKTWTGMGKPPTWIAGAKNRDDFLIKGGSRAASATTASSASAKPKALRAGAGVAKYQDPKTGKTWTGVGKPPAWIAGAKNRDDFLIGAKPVAAEVTNGVAKKSARPAVARKGAGSTKVRSFKKSAQKLENRRGKKVAAPAKTSAAPEETAAAA